jgi:CheY-like chemotaxis protein
MNPSSGPLRRNLRLIVCDDERDTVATLCEILRDEGDQVREAHAGVQAIREVRAAPPDAVIVDINMPGISGYEVAREVRRLYGEFAPVMIAISGRWTGQTDRMLSKLAGFEYFLEKPCDPQVLLSLLAPLRRQPPKPPVSLIDDTQIPPERE